MAEKLYTAPWQNEIDEAEARRRIALPKDHPLFTDFRHKWGCIYRYGAVPETASACGCLQDSGG